MNNHQSPLVSVLIPTYNRPHFFEIALESVLAQTYKNLDIVICDNSTNEETAELMKRYEEDSRICYIRNKKARTKKANFAPFATAAHGEYLQWLMDDDVLETTKIEKMLTLFLENPGVTLAASNRRWIDAVGNEISMEKQVNLGEDVEYAVIEGKRLGKYMLMGVRNLIGEPSSVLFRRADLQHHYWQAECRGYKTISDVVMWLELLEKGDCAFFQQPLSSYRRHQEQEGQQIDVVVLSRLEWIRLIGEAHKSGYFISDRSEYITAMQRFLLDAESVILPAVKNLESNHIVQQYKEQIKEIRCKIEMDHL